jgi:molybdopterin converting factor subunit 1
MNIKVKFFSSHREAVGQDSLLLDLEEGTSIDQVVELLISDYPKISELLNFTVLSLNHNYAQGEDILKDGDELAMFPPVGGG